MTIDGTVRRLRLPKKSADYMDGAGAFLTLIGAVVLFGWFARKPLLIQIAPQFAPMQFNTALCFFLSGIGLLAVNRDQNRIAWICAAIVGLIGMLTLCEYMFRTDLLIDELFMKAYITTQTSHPGRMAPNTALCFTLTAMMTVIAINSRRWNKARLVEEALGFAILALALVPLVGYLRHVETAYGWGSLTRMAPHTAIGFVAFAVGAIAFAWRKKTVQSDAFSFWLVPSLAIGALLLDLNTPPEIAASIAYAPLVCCGVWLKRPSAPAALAAFASTLIVLGFFAVASGASSIETEIANRSISLAAVWVTAFLVYLHQYAQRNSDVMQERLRLIFENAGEGIYGTDLNGRVIFANRAAQLLLGYSNEEITELHQNDIAQRKDADGGNASTSRPGLEYLQSQGVFQRKDGGTLSVDYTSTPIRDGDSGAQGVVVVFRDITMRQKLEQEREQLLSKYIATNYDLENFARVASHDLQEPLRKLMVYSSMLKQDLGDSLTEQAEADLDVISTSAERMQRLVKETLRLARVSDEVLELSETNPAEAAEAAVVNLKQRIHDVGAEITYESLPPVLAEMTLLKQIYQNLIGNALKFVTPGQTPCIIMTAEKTDFGDVVLGVRDNGIGIAPDDQEKIFQPLTRLHGSDRFEGAGIGLAICKRAVDRFGGDIWVESEKGAGAHFKFTLKAPARQSHYAA